MRAIIRRCVTCRRHEGSPFKLPLPPPLPKERVTRAAPFEFVGLDYFSPLLTRSSDGVVTKVWVCLYTCFAVRAVHLECVLDMSTDHFIASLRRFIARRGVPRLLYSDNASQFKLASSVLDEDWRDATSDPMVQDYLTNHDIVWKFTTALAPWQGGLYERMVGLVKRSLRKSIGRQLLTVNQLTTVLAEAEAAVNSRPLTTVPADSEGLDYQILTPAHFLIGGRPASIPLQAVDNSDPDFLPTSASPSTQHLNAWKRQQQQSAAFWRLWQRDYLQMLQARSTPSSFSPHARQHGRPEVGEVVLIGEDDTPRAVWRLGRVAELIVSPTDNEVRSAVVQTPAGHAVTRPLCKLYPLECRASTPPPARVDTRDQTPPADVRPSCAAARKALENIAKWTTS